MKWYNIQMATPEKDKLNRLEELKSKLFSTSFKTKIEYRDNFTKLHKPDVPDSWAEEKQVESNSPFTMKTSIFKKFFIFSIVFFVLALGYVAYVFFGGVNTVSNANIDISVLGNTFTAGGEELPLQIEIINRNSSDLELVDLVVEYPNGSASGFLSSFLGNTERMRLSLGTIRSGSVHNENIKIILFGEQGSVNQIKISLEYRISGSNAIFVKDKLYEVTINSTPINLIVDTSPTVSPNEDMKLDIRATLNATKVATGMMIKVEYPFGFQFTKATPSPTLGNNVWSLGDISPGAESHIVIEGRMVDVFDGEEKTFQIRAGTQDKNDKSQIGVIFNSIGKTVAIVRPYLTAKVSINGSLDREVPINSKAFMQGRIEWANNLEYRLTDMEVRAKISGNAYDRRTVKAQTGFYNSVENTIVWNKNYDSAFASVPSGGSGNLIFSLSPLALYSATDGMLTQPTINIDVTITGKYSSDVGVNQNISNSESKIVKLITEPGLGTKALYGIGPLKNTGPIPPKAEQETTYTIVWALTNSANNISKAQVRATLPPWIVFKNAISPTNENMTYNSTTREIVWNAGNLPRGTGITSASREVAFQVGFTPSLSQVGEAPTLINQAVLTGMDDFANVEVRVNKGVLDTRSVSDLNSTSKNAIVVE